MYELTTRAILRYNNTVEVGDPQAETLVKTVAFSMDCYNSSHCNDACGKFCFKRFSLKVEGFNSAKLLSVSS